VLRRTIGVGLGSNSDDQTCQRRRQVFLESSYDPPDAGAIERYQLRLNQCVGL
jgi:hypothetical protein